MGIGPGADVSVARREAVEHDLRRDHVPTLSRLHDRSHDAIDVRRKQLLGQDGALVSSALQTSRITLREWSTARFGGVVSLVHVAILRSTTRALNGGTSPQRH